MTAELRDGTETVRLTDTAPAPERMSEGDMELMLSFQQDLNAAQRAFNTLMAQFSRRYQLSEGDRVNMDGTIVRQS